MTTKPHSIPASVVWDALERIPPSGIRVKARARNELRLMEARLKLDQERIQNLEEQLEAARKALFKCYEASGADTDGARTLSDMGRIDPPIEVLAVRAVEELRRDYDKDPS
jgi:hypothetical protein